VFSLFVSQSVSHSLVAKYKCDLLEKNYEVM